MSKYMFVVLYFSDPDKIHIERLEVKDQSDRYFTFVTADNITVHGCCGEDCFETYDDAFRQALHSLGVFASELVEDNNTHFYALKSNADCYDANWSDGYTIEEFVFDDVAKSALKLSSIGCAVTRLLKEAAKHLREEMD